MWRMRFALAVFYASGFAWGKGSEWTALGLIILALGLAISTALDEN